MKNFGNDEQEKRVYTQTLNISQKITRGHRELLEIKSIFKGNKYLCELCG